MRRIRYRWEKWAAEFAATTVWLVVWCGAANAADPFFIGLGDLPGGGFSSSASGVSDDGSVVVGISSSTPGSQAFRWTQSGGMVGLGDLPGANYYSTATDVSADGAVVVGYSNYSLTWGGPGCGCWQPRPGAFRWTQTGGMVLLGDYGTIAGAYGASADGSVVVGGTFGNPAFRWTLDTGMESLTGVVGATGVSADGSVVVGSFDVEAVRWTLGGGIVGLGDLPGETFLSQPYAVSSDGSVVVGWSDSDAVVGYEAFRWTNGGGMVGLGVLPGFTSSLAYDVSTGGSIVVGNSSDVTGSEAFLWDATHGMRSLRDVLVNDFGMRATLAGWTLSSATGVSGDGQVIVGSGTNPNGNTEAWLARIKFATTIPGDFNIDGIVNAADYDVWKTNFGSTTILDADGNGDGRVNAADFTGWRNNLGATLLGSGAAGALPSHAAAPEPFSCALAVLCILGVPIGHRRRGRHQ